MEVELYVFLFPHFPGRYTIPDLSKETDNAVTGLDISNDVSINEQLLNIEYTHPGKSYHHTYPIPVF